MNDQGAPLVGSSSTVYCSPCNRYFQNAQAMRDHLSALIHGGGMRCVVCLQIHFNDDETLAKHVSSQTHPLFCKDCTNIFYSKLELTEHWETEHPKISAKSFTLNQNTIHSVTSQWSKVDAAEEVHILEELSEQCHSFQDLKENHFRLVPYTTEKIEALIKCGNCGSTPCPIPPSKEHS